MGFVDVTDDASPRLAADQASAQMSVAALAQRTLFNLHKSFNWAWLDVICQYRRSRIGPWWETLNVIVMILGLSLVSTAVFGGNPKSVIGFIGIGVVVWSAITAMILEGSPALIRCSNFVLGSNIGIDLYIGRTVFRIFITFCHNILLYFIGAALLIVPIGWTSLLAIPGIALLFINAFWVVTALAIFCARFRDVEMIVRNLLQLAFFVTPVFWNYHNIPSNRHFVIDYNILFYFIEIIRSPLLGEVPPLSYYLVVLGVTVVGYGLAYLIYYYMRRELAFFV